MLICGGGVRYSEAWKDLQKFAEEFNIPIGETQAGKGLIAWDHPLNLGGIGVTGTKAANLIARDADLIIGAGTRFTDFTTNSKWGFRNPECKILAINVCSFDAVKMDAEGILADAREALSAIRKELKNLNYQSKYTDEIIEAKKEWDDIVNEYYNLPEEKNGIPQTQSIGRNQSLHALKRYRCRICREFARRYAEAVPPGQTRYLSHGIWFFLYGI